MSFLLNLTISVALVAGMAKISLVQPAATPSVAALAVSSEHDDVLKTVQEFKKVDPQIENFFNGSAGYAVLPTVGKGAVGVGGAHGTGELIVAGKANGTVAMTQITIGLALGGQAYSEVIFFENQAQLDHFRHGDFEFAAQTTAVALKSGVAKNASYRDGVAVFTIAKGGLMAEASVGGQKFSYKAY